jgi:hypothetical protein
LYVVGSVLPDVGADNVEAASAAAEWIKDHVTVPRVELKLLVRDGAPAPIFLVNASTNVKAGT